MLNDLLSIEREMAAHGVEFARRHPDIKDLAKGPAFLVRLDDAGSIVGIHIVAEAGRGALWTLRDGQHNGFPGLKTAAGLLFLDANARKEHNDAWESDETSTGRRNELLRLLAAYPFDTGQISTWPNAGHRKRIAERLRGLRPLPDDPVTAAVPAAFERFLLALDASPSFLEGLSTILAQRVHSRGDEWLEPVRAALTGQVALAIDVANSDFQRDACDPRQIGPVSAALSTYDDQRNHAEGGGWCALSGKAVKLHTGSFPQPNLPGLGQTYIFSRNRDIPSLIRYGRTADASFPIDADLVRRLSGAITALTREEARDRTWRLIPAERGEKPDLLVASIAADPDAKLASAVADDEDEVGGESAWNELGARVIKQSRGIYKHEYAQGEVNLLILRTLDPANRKAIYHRNTSAARFFDAAERWRKATANIPEWLGFHLPLKGKPELIFCTPPRVAPLSVTPLSRVQFVNGGRRRVNVIGVTAADAFGLFLREGKVDQRARKLLRLMVQRHGLLLTGLAAARVKGTEYLKDFDPKTDLRRDALRSVGWVGVLLHFLGRLKEAYMSGAAFRLGQLLAAADVVHIGYCADMRGGNIPMTLIGNSVFSIAGSNPARALSILYGRWKPYDAWAKPRPRLEEKMKAIFDKSKPLRDSAEKLKREGNKEEASKLDRRAAAIEVDGWAMRNGLSQARRIRPLSTQLAEELRCLQVSDHFRAELLLGYMSGLPPASMDTGELSTTGHYSINQNEGE